MLGQPDIGIFGLRDNVDACRHIARSVSIPLMADADTGYGNAVTVYHVVQYFEEAGIVGINIEDQLMPKRCGHMRGKELVEPREMARKIEARAQGASAIRTSSSTRAPTPSRSRASRAPSPASANTSAAGADMIYPDAIRNEDDIQRVIEAAGDVPGQRQHGLRHPLAAHHAAHPAVTD